MANTVSSLRSVMRRDVEMADDLKALCEVASTSDVLKDTSQIIVKTRDYTYQSVNKALILRNWLLGRRISQEVLRDGSFEETYGKKLIADLSKELTSNFGKGFSPSNLYKYVRFYKAFPEILSTLWTQSFSTLSWSHYRILLQVEDDDARYWYEKEASDQTWAVRTLQRNIDSQYYYRMLKTPDPQAVESEMRALTVDYETEKLSFIKDPVVVEFLGLSPDDKYTESDLETRIIDNLQKFLLELGKGYAFMARQQHIHTEAKDYFIDLVFYNVYLKCYVLIDLKTTRVNHQDVGQMDMYVRMYDELKRVEGDNPTLGIILCSNTDEDVARYSILHDNDRLFATKYKLYLPSDEVLRREIETQKELYEMRQLDSELEKKGL